MNRSRRKKLQRRVRRAAIRQYREAAASPRFFDLNRRPVLVVGSTLEHELRLLRYALTAEQMMRVAKGPQTTEADVERMKVEFAQRYPELADAFKTVPDTGCWNCGEKGAAVPATDGRNRCPSCWASRPVNT